jgi:hypothetical protein
MIDKDRQDIFSFTLEYETTVDDRTVNTLL